MKYQLLIVVLLGLSLAPAGAVALAPNISGTWACSIDRPEANGGPINVTFVFKQNGENLTGTYSGFGPHREEKITGTVKEDKVVFGWEMKGPPGLKKPPIQITFTGAIESPTRITGSIGSPFCGAGCKWNATKKK
jgi:hypothetical protein